MELYFVQDIKETLDLDQTTMIGSALDLDSLDGESQQQQSTNGSQAHHSAGAYTSSNIVVPPSFPHTLPHSLGLLL